MTRADSPLLAIVNPRAAGGRCASRFDHWRANGGAHLDLEVVFTEGPRHATELAAGARAAGRRRLLSVGGDGTLFEIVNGLLPAPRDERPELAVLPLGTGNSFPRDLGIASQGDASRALDRGELRPVDAVRVEHADGVLYYVNLLGLGFAARAGHLTNTRFKSLGPLGYVAAVVACVARLEHPIDAIRLDGALAVDARPAALLAFSNTRFTGGSMRLAPLADSGDGQLDVIRIGALSRGAFLAAFPGIFAGTHVEHPEIEQSRARRVEFAEPREQPVMVDGEILQLTLHALEVVPGALSVIGAAP